MHLEKKNLAFVLLVVLLTASGIGNIILLIFGGFFSHYEKITCVVGYPSDPFSIDPVDTWDGLSYGIEQQVVEGLVEYDISSHPNYFVKPKLAESWHWHSNTKISFKIREDIFFHDGTSLDADAVKWNFERLVYFCNASGTLPANQTEALASSLYYLNNGTLLFNHFEVPSKYNFTIYLNSQFNALLDLLTFTATYICSPSSTPIDRYIDIASEKIVGTGPFKYINYKRNSEVRLERWERYWRTNPYFEEVVFKITGDPIARMNAMLGGQFDYMGRAILPSFIDIFNSSTNIHVEEVGESLSYNYIEFYCGPGDPADNHSYDYQTLNATWRKTLSLAINYSYIKQEIGQGTLSNGIPAIPRAMSAHNSSIILPDYWQDIYGYEAAVEWAREIIKSMFPAETISLDSTFPGTTELGWKALSLRTIELNEIFESGVGFALNLVFEESWELIGVDVHKTIRTFGEYFETGENSPWEMEVSAISWTPDYLDAFNMLNPLFNINSTACFSRINDTYLTSLLLDASKEFDSNLRDEICKEIQSYIFDLNFDNPATLTHAPLPTSIVYNVHKTDLKGILYNVIEISSIYHWYREE
ncbi:MAG: ABC transporter substrate-binding protein [Candidatus Thorarchaeota archaeon]